ncbi:type II toxin-antitoxin system HicB family antitoxin [Nocardiopsis oceani]
MIAGHSCAFHHSARAAVVDTERLRHYLSVFTPWQAEAEAVAEDGGFSVFIPGVPVAADAPTFDEAVTEMVEALREYAEGWQHRFLDTPNHRENGGLVQLVTLSSDTQLRAWILGEGSDALPAELVHLLVTRAGVDEAEVARMSKEEAVDRMCRYWTDGL